MPRELFPNLYDNGMNPEALRKMREAWSMYREELGFEADKVNGGRKITDRVHINEFLQAWYVFFNRSREVNQESIDDVVETKKKSW